MIAHAPALQKPTLRGVSHQIAAFVAFFAGVFLFSRAPRSASAAVAIYTVSLTALLGSARPTTGPRGGRTRARGCAASIAPRSSCWSPGRTRRSRSRCPTTTAVLRWVVWSGAAAGVLQSLLWVTAPKPLVAVIYVVLGWSILPYVRLMHAAVGAGPLALLLGGGVVYSLGALVYAKKRPDPVPRVFGYHEVFHALVIFAATLHYAAVVRVVLR